MAACHYTPSGATVDLQPPTLSELAFDPHQEIFTGVAEDNLGAVRIELFDGPVLLASSDPAKVAGSVAKVVFPGYGTAFYSKLHLASGSYTLTAVAADAGGNQAQQNFKLVVP